MSDEAAEIQQWVDDFAEASRPVNFYEVREMVDRARGLGMELDPATNRIVLETGTVKDSIEKIRMVAQDPKNFAMVLDEVERFRLRLIASQIFKGIWHNVSYQIVR